MIDGHSGNYIISTLVKSQDEVIKRWEDFWESLRKCHTHHPPAPLSPPQRYMDLGQRTYTFAQVKGTDYR